MDSKQVEVVATATGVDSDIISGVSTWSTYTFDTEGKGLQKINWLHIYVLAVPPLLSLYALLTVPVKLQTFLLSAVVAFMTGFGITAGYHRLWAHRAYKATLPVKVILAIAGAAAMQGSAKWWCRNHRAHHRYVDTPKDPYNAKNGFFYSHIGWMIYKQDANKIGRVDVKDLAAGADPVVTWQHKNYLMIALTSGFVLPTLIASLWGDSLGGFLYAGMFRMMFVHHCTFAINSLAHSIGEQSYTDAHTARDHFITAFITLGEGYHNFHHTYPNDYRNGVKWYQVDPTKWLVYTLSLFGLTYDLKRYDNDFIKETELQMTQLSAAKQLEGVERDLGNKDPCETLFSLGHDAALPREAYDSLPELMTIQEMADKVKEGYKLVAVSGSIIRVDKWIDQHPGGASEIERFLGKDATAVFNGAVYNHSRIARTMLKHLTVSRVKVESKQA